MSNIIVGNNDGVVRVVGDIEWTNAGLSDNLTFDPGEAFELNTDTGSILMTDSGGNLAGSLILNGPNLWIASGSILRQLESDPNFAGREAALGSNSGTANPLGFVGAGTINALVWDTFFVQNSGTATDLGGLTVGDESSRTTTTGLRKDG